MQRKLLVLAVCMLGLGCRRDQEVEERFGRPAGPESEPHAQMAGAAKATGCPGLEEVTQALQRTRSELQALHRELEPMLARAPAPEAQEPATGGAADAGLEEEVTVGASLLQKLREVCSQLPEESAVGGAGLETPVEDEPAQKNSSVEAEISRLREEVRELEQKLSDRSPPRAPNSPPKLAVTERVLTGEVVAVSKGALVIRGDGVFHRLRLTEQTRAARNGSRISVEQLGEGTQVRAVARQEQGDLVARTVEALPRK